MNDLIKLQDQLQAESRELLEHTKIMNYLSQLGTVIQTGSSVTGLMVYPDIDFAVQNEDPNISRAIELTPKIFSELKASELKIADFSDDNQEGASYYIGFELPYKGKTWHIDATVTKPGSISTNPPELAGWLEKMTDDERGVVLRLKTELINAHRYLGARSYPPYTFRSAHVYEAVLAGKARSVGQLERYFQKR